MVRAASPISTISAALMLKLLPNVAHWPIPCPVSGNFSGVGRRRRFRWPFLQLAVDIVARGHRMRIRRAAALGPGRVVSNQEIGRAAVGLRHLPVGGNLGVGIGRQLLDGGHRIAVEACDQGLNREQGIRRQIGVVIMHEVVLMNRQLGLRAAILIFHPDVMLGTASATAATAVSAAARSAPANAERNRNRRPADRGAA